MVDDRNGTAVQEILAANLRRLRIARHLSLSELARATGMSKATLSGIENGRANPTVETLASLAGALRSSMTDLLEQPPLRDVRIVRAAKPLAEVRDGVSQRLLDEFPSDRVLELAEIVVPARHEREVGASPAGSRAHLYVFQGTLIAGPVERLTELGPSDYAAFPSDVPWSYETGRQAARALMVREAPR